MAFKFGNSTPSFSAVKVDTNVLTASVETMNQAWTDLSEQIRSDRDLTEYVRNINIALRAIDRFGSAAIPVVNADGWLESILSIPERSITVERAVEGLGEAAREAFRTFWEWLKRVAGLIKNFFIRLFDFQTKKAEEVDSVAKSSEEVASSATVAAIASDAQLPSDAETTERVAEALEKHTDLVDNLFKVEQNAEASLDSLHKLQEELSPGSNSVMNDLYVAIDAMFTAKKDMEDTFAEVDAAIDRMYPRTAELKKKTEEIQAESQTVSEAMRDYLNSSGLDDYSTEATNIHVSVVNNSKIGGVVTKRCKSSKLRAHAQRSKKFSDSVIKFHADLELRLKKIENYPEVLSKVQSAVKKIESMITEVSKLDASLTKCATRMTSRVAGRLRNR